MEDCVTFIIKLAVLEDCCSFSFVEICMTRADTKIIYVDRERRRRLIGSSSAADSSLSPEYPTHGP